MNFIEIKEEVLRRHNLTLTENDPILVTVTLYNLMLEAAQNQFNAQLEHMYRKLEELSTQQELSHKQTAQRIIHTSLEASRNSILASADEITTSIRGLQHDSQNAFLQEYQKQVQELKSYRNITVICVFICVITSLLTLTTLLMGYL